MKKLFTVLLAVLASVFLFASCSALTEVGEKSGDKSDLSVSDVYNMYVAYAQENGDTPYSYEEWLEQIRGENGLNGVGIAEMIIDDGMLYVRFTDSEELTLIGEVQGAAGEKGQQGETGNGIEKIELTSSVNGVDTYTITFTNGETATFTVTNGKDGKDGEDGQQGEQGNDGRGIEKVFVKDGWVTVQYTDGQSEKIYE